MLRTMSTPRNDHLRNLIDQRSARTESSRYTTVSEYSVKDTPSIYSTNTFAPQYQDDYDEPLSPMSDRERLQNPAASSLDLEDDYRSSYTPSDSYGDDQDKSQLSIQDDDSRMSMLGPKMRIHGRAPWEMGEETLDEGDESDSSGKSRIFTKKGSKGKANKGFGMGASNPRPSLPSRPSFDSALSGPRSKGSFETISSNVSNSQGALHALAHASMSSSSLQLPAHEPSGKGSTLRNKFSMPRIRPRTPSNLTRDQSPMPPSPNSTTFNHSPTASEFSRASTTSSPRPSTSPNPRTHDSFAHPYANPDLVVSYSEEPEPFQPQRAQTLGSGYGNITRSDSISTITDVLPTPSRSTLHQVASASSFRQNSLPNPRPSTLSAKEISSPVSSLRAGDIPPSPQRVREPQVMARPPAMGPNGIPGWMDNPGSPTIQLISLAEAQAQAKERARSATVNGSVPFPEPEQSPSPTGSNHARSRARSISAGAKAKSALSNIVGGPSQGSSEPSAGVQSGSKSLKHKKSGFMKLFNGKEKEAIPPVPTLSDAYNSQNTSSQTSSTASRAPKISLARVPAPSFSMDDASSADASTAKRTPPPPPLKIVTSNHSGEARMAPNSHLAIPSAGPAPKKPRGNQPATAPASTTDFPSLSLRPMSTIFSAHFADHIVKPGTGSPVEEEPNTPSSISPGTGASPITPGSPLRNSGGSTDEVSIPASSEDQSKIIRALQSQIASSRKAWQQHIWELEGQVRDLKAEVEDMRAMDIEKGYCDSCGRGESDDRSHNHPKKVGVLDRPRARTGDGTAARFTSGN